MKDAKGHGSDARGAHAAGVEQVGQQPLRQPESPESRELRLFADNDADLHRQSEVPVLQNLGQKMDKGAYDPAKATTLWGYHADRAAQSYVKQFGGATGAGRQTFTPAVRREAAANWEQDHRDSLKSGEYGNPYPAHQTNLRAAWDKKHGRG
jgi:hypothetical protein